MGYPVWSWNFITIDKNDAHAKGQGQVSKVKVTEVKANFVPIWAQNLNIFSNAFHGILTIVVSTFSIDLAGCNETDDWGL